MKLLDKYSFEDFIGMDEETLSHVMDDSFACMDVKDDALAESAFEEVNRSLRMSGSIKRRNTARRVARYATRAFAVACVPLAIAFLVDINTPEPDIQWSEINVENGKTQTVALSDGTELFLNSGSRITFPDTFTGSERGIFLDGHVYAKVHKDPEHPFVIHAKDMDVRVLGTTFDLNAYDNNDCVEIILLEGSVKLDVNTPDKKRHVTMEPGDVVHYDRITDDVEVNSLQVPLNALKVQSNFHFFNIPLEDICRDLERRFDRNIFILDDELGKTEFFAFFSNGEGLEDILSLLNADKKMIVEEKGNNVFIRKRI